MLRWNGAAESGGDLFADVVSEQCPRVVLRLIPQISAWAVASESVDPTHTGLIYCPERVAMVAAETLADGVAATLLTWHQQRGQPKFKAFVLAECDLCSMSAQSAHLLQKEGCERMEEYCVELRRVQHVRRR